MSTIALADMQSSSVQRGSARRETVQPGTLQRDGSQRAVVGTRLRLTRRGRVVLTTLAALPLLLVVGLIALNGGQASAGNTAADVHFQTVTIEPGETLWQLAEQTAPNADPRDFIQDVVSLNALDGSGVQAGEQIAIPAKYADAK